MEPVFLMNKTEKKELKFLTIDLNDRSDDNAISAKVENLKGSGSSKVNLEIQNSVDQNVNNILLDIDLFLKIKTIQDLPDWVIIKLILAEGKLSETDFKKRVLNG